mmetsp:Transcript_30536/g.87580  ORF Transcript_30536/g.87580 Transcript_30536/m.87580 type:complete len:302 (+) Transcript_30536:1212-2117(+)
MAQADQQTAPLLHLVRQSFGARPQLQLLQHGPSAPLFSIWPETNSARGRHWHLILAPPAVQGDDQPLWRGQGLQWLLPCAKNAGAWQSVECPTAAIGKLQEQNTIGTNLFFGYWKGVSRHEGRIRPKRIHLWHLSQLQFPHLRRLVKPAAQPRPPPKRRHLRRGPLCLDGVLCLVLQGPVCKVRGCHLRPLLSWQGGDAALPLFHGYQHMVQPWSWQASITPDQLNGVPHNLASSPLDGEPYPIAPAWSSPPTTCRENGLVHKPVLGEHVNRLDAEQLHPGTELAFRPTLCVANGRVCGCR